MPGGVDSKQEDDTGLGGFHSKRIAGQELGTCLRCGYEGDPGLAEDIRQLVRGQQGRTASSECPRLLGTLCIKMSEHCSSMKPWNIFIIHHGVSPFNPDHHPGGQALLLSPLYRWTHRVREDGRFIQD